MRGKTDKGTKWALRCYRRYLQAPDHISKLRVIRFLESVLIPPDGGIFQVENKLLMYLHPRDQGEYVLIQSGKYEPLTLSFFEKNLRVGQVVLLAGVNFGLHLMVCSRCVGEKGCVIGVEPQPTSLRRTLQNISINQLSANIKLISGGLAGAQGIVTMSEAPPENSGWASMVLRDSGKHPYYIQVDSVRNFLDRLGLNHLDFMLLDVEGYEIPVLEGMLHGPKPSVLIVEVHPAVIHYMKTDAKTYYAALTQLGYNCFNLYGETVSAGAELPENNVIGVLQGSAMPCWPKRH